MNEHEGIPIKLYLQKIDASWAQPEGQSLQNPELDDLFLVPSSSEWP